MTERQLPPEPSDFAAAVERKMKSEGREWDSLATDVGLDVTELRSQLNDPASLKLLTARKVATALDIDVWGTAA